MKPSVASSNNNNTAFGQETSSKAKDGASRIIPIKVERGNGAFSQQNDNSSPINNLEELRSHQAQKGAEETIRGYSKPNVRCFLACQCNV